MSVDSTPWSEEMSELVVGGDAGFGWPAIIILRTELSAPVLPIITLPLLPLAKLKLERQFSGKRMSSIIGTCGSPLRGSELASAAMRSWTGTAWSSSTVLTPRWSLILWYTDDLVVIDSVGVKSGVPRRLDCSIQRVKKGLKLECKRTSAPTEPKDSP